MPFGSFLSFGSSINPSIAWSRGKQGEGRFRITFPLDSTWYNEQKHTHFRSLEHRKERYGRFRHEFIVLTLEDDSPPNKHDESQAQASYPLCRVERLGDPNASFNAISPQGIVAHDVIQSFPRDKISDACLESSDVVAKITFPRHFDLKIVLLICRAMQEGEKTCNYTLQVFNCYFFALAIQAALTRLVADWRDPFMDKTWHLGLERGLSDLSGLYKTAVPGNQQPFMLRAHSALRPGVQWPAEDLVCNLKRELRQLTDVSQLCNAILWYEDTNLVIDHVLGGRVRDAVVRLLKDQLHHSDQRPCTKSPDAPRLDSVMIQFKDSLLELISRAISIHDQELRASRLSRIQSSLQQRVHITQEFESFLSGVRQTKAKEWTLGFLPSNLQPHPDPPRPDPSQPYPDLSQSRPDPSEARPDSSQPHPNPSPTYPPNSPKPRPDSSWSICLSHFFKLKSRLSAWLAYAKVLALWTFQVVLGLFWIDLLGSAQPILCRFIEDELESSIAILKTSGQESVDQFTLISQKLGSLIAAPRLLVQWKERPWDHVYQPIRQGIRKLIDSEREVLQVSFSGRTNQPTRVSEFQKRLLDRIRDHAKRVESYGLGSTTKIQDEMETRISQVWALIRPDDTTPTPAEASTPTTAQPEIRELTVPPLDLDDPTEPSSPSPSIDREQSPPSPGRFDEDGELRKRFKGVPPPAKPDDNLQHRYDVDRRSPPVDDEFMPDEGPSGFVHQYTGERRFYY